MASRIGELSAAIARNTAQVEDYLQSHSLPVPSFDIDGPLDLQLPEHIDQARIAAIDASQELNDLLRGPVALVRPVLNGTSLQAIYRYDIATKIPLNGTISFAELAQLCRLPEIDVRRILRFAMSWHRCFCEPLIGRVAHTAASRKLAGDPLMRDGLGLMFDECWPSYARTVDALQESGSQDSTKTGYSLAHNTPDSLYDYLAKHPAKAKQFGNAMTSFTSQEGSSPKYVVEGYDWASIGEGTVVDLGGAEGHISIALAEKYPSLDFIVQELLPVVEQAKDKIPEAFADRVQLMEHDFFTPQPITADVYLLRWIFHNYPDTYCVKILQNLIPALKEGARIVVVDNIVPEPGTISQMAEREIRAMDMLMLTLFNAQERQESDWIHLFREADRRFVFKCAVVPKGSALGVIEFVWQT